MKHILYSLCVGSTILALAASGASAAKPDPKKKGRSKASAQVVSPAKGKAAAKSGGKARVQRSVARPRASSRATVKRSSVRTDRGRAISKPSVATRSKDRTSRDVVTRSKGRASREAARTRSARTAERAATTKTFAGSRAARTREKALGRENTLRSTGREAARTRTAQTAAARTRVDARRNLKVNRQRNLTLARNVLRNRAGDVRIVNHWRSDRFRDQKYAAFYNYNRTWHNRHWWRSNFTRTVFVLGGWWAWDAGYWYPCWGYDPYASYPYDGPIYTGYADLAPDQVIINVQVQLRDYGYYAGAIDGLMGPQTRAALAAFQADNGLAVTSAVDRPTLQTLGVA